jgi:SAM-dependent methyltransferase
MRQNKAEIVAHNKSAWDMETEAGNPWTIPVSAEAIAQAKNGNFELYLTDSKPVPRSWIPELNNCRVLCLASGGGQQGPLLAAAGAKVTVLDNSPKQLDRDRLVAEREGLEIQTIEGDMADLSIFIDHSYDFIVHPISNCFIPEIQPVWNESFRVLVPDGTLISGFINPVDYIFDRELYDKGDFKVRHSIPYSDLYSLDEEERIRVNGETAPLEFGHSLEDQIGGQIKAGFHIIGFFDDYRNEGQIRKHMPSYIATRAWKPIKYTGF